MNMKQRRVLVTAGVFIVIAFLFPPTYFDDRFRYQWILGSWYGRVEVLVLLAEWFGICLLAGIGWLLFRDTHPKGL